MINMIVDGNTTFDRSRNILLKIKFKKNINGAKDFKYKKIKYLKKNVDTRMGKIFKKVKYIN